MKKIITGFLLIISMTGYSQNGEKNFIDQNYIEVTGKAEMNIVPDMIYLDITLRDKENKNKQSLDEIDKAMTSKLTEIGIDITKDLSVKDIVSNYKSYLIVKTEVILTKQYQLIVHDSKTLQKIYYEFQKLGISNVNIDRLDHSKMIQYRKDIKKNAIKAAKEKAESLTEALNQSIGRAIFIQELDNSSTYIPNVYRNRLSTANTVSNNVMSEDSNEFSMPEIEFQKINIQYSILVRFELK